VRRTESASAPRQIGVENAGSLLFVGGPYDLLLSELFNRTISPAKFRFQYPTMRLLQPDNSQKIRYAAQRGSSMRSHSILRIKQSGRVLNTLSQTHEVVHGQTFRRNQMRELEGGDEPETKSYLARASGKIIVSARDERLSVPIKLK
jgi:hypothetical protein